MIELIKVTHNGQMKYFVYVNQEAVSQSDNLAEAIQSYELLKATHSRKMQTTVLMREEL